MVITKLKKGKRFWIHVFRFRISTLTKKEILRIKSDNRFWESMNETINENKFCFIKDTKVTSKAISF